LLEMLAIDGAIVTIDAMGKAGQRFRQAQPDGMARRGCQREIAQKILDKKADYVLALKGNQGSLREDVELFAAEQKAKGFTDTMVSQEVDGDHDASKPEPPPSSTMSNGYKSAITGRV
jgi:predicted transposase YbfD/YdcC